MKMKRRILVTGGAGFIGSHMAERLIQLGHRVTIVDNLSSGSKENLPHNATFVLCDVSKEKEVKNLFETNTFDAVFHIAGNASIIKSFINPLTDFKKNFVGTVNLVSECIKYSVPRFLYASSMTIYGQPKEKVIKETVNPTPISYYGISKFSAERFVHATAMRSDLTSPFDVTSFRMFNVYGPRQSLTNSYQGVMGIFIGNLLRKEPITIFGDGNQSRDLIYIDDVVNAWVKSLDNEKTFGKVFNVGYGKDVSVNDMVKILLKRFKKPDSYPIIRKPKRTGEQRYTCADTSKLRRAIDWKPKNDLNTGLTKTIRWAKKAYDLSS